jgi:hypothetical protein
MERALGLSARSCHDLRMRKWGWKGVLELSGWKEAKYIVVSAVIVCVRCSVGEIKSRPGVLEAPLQYGKVYRL